MPFYLPPRPLVLFFALLPAIGLCNAYLQSRDNVCTYFCPLADLDYKVLGLNSGSANNVLRCNYPFLYQCQYDPVSNLSSSSKMASFDCYM